MAIEIYDREYILEKIYNQICRTYPASRISYKSFMSSYAVRTAGEWQMNIVENRDPFLLDSSNYRTCQWEKLFPEICDRLEFLSWTASWQSRKPSSSGSVVVFPVASKLSVTRPNIPEFFLLDTQKFLFHFSHDIN